MGYGGGIDPICDEIPAQIHVCHDQIILLIPPPPFYSITIGLEIIWLGEFWRNCVPPTSVFKSIFKSRLKRNFPVKGIREKTGWEMGEREGITSNHRV